MTSLFAKFSSVKSALLFVFFLAACESCTSAQSQPVETTKSVSTQTPTSASAPATTLGERFNNAPFMQLIDAPKTVALVPSGELSSSAAACGACHTDIYSEWKVSTHANALRDPQFLAELAKESSPKWLCLNCHIPLQNQRPYLVNQNTEIVSKGHDLREIKKVKNPNYDPRLRDEAITCATCHVRRGDDGRGHIIGPRGDVNAPHLVKKDKEALTNMCVRCHNPGPVRLTPSFFCWFETGDEAKKVGDKTCVSCHMQEVERPLAIASPSRKSRHHWFAGSPIPKTFEAFGVAPRPTGLDFESELKIDKTRQEAELRFVLSNARGEHAITTADPERYLLVEVIASTEGKEQRFTRRLGQEWDFGDDKSERPARRLKDSRLFSGQSREFVFNFAHPKNTRVTTRVKHVRLSAQNAGFMKKTPLDDVVQYRSDIKDVMRTLEQHYPFFAMIYEEVRQNGERTLTSDSLLMQKNVDAKNFSLDELKRTLSVDEER